MFDLVIQEVCDSSQVDFEESGVDQQTLLDLRQVCFFFFFFFFRFLSNISSFFVVLVSHLEEDAGGCV